MLNGWAERRFAAFGTTVEILVHGGDAALLDWATGEVERLEQSWSRFRPDSELSRLNADRRPTVGASSLLMEVLLRSQIGWHLTSGRFDPTVIDALESIGYASSFQTFCDPMVTTESRPSPTMVDVVIDPQAGTISRPVGVRFDLGGIGKGLMADFVSTGLIERGARSVCVGAGGDVRVAGDAPDGGWQIPVENPASGGEWFVASLESGAIVTSTTRYRRWVGTDGRVLHHLIDPSTGSPSASGLSAVVVAASEAWWAEVLAKAALVAGRMEGVTLLDEHHVTGWMVDTELMAA